MLKTLLIVGAGSFTGGALRYLLSKAIQSWGFHSFPVGTFCVNILGCLAIGLFYGLFERNNLMSANLRLFLTVGLCGGFTTFSTFINESFQMIRDANFLCGVEFVGRPFHVVCGVFPCKMVVIWNWEKSIRHCGSI